MLRWLLREEIRLNMYKLIIMRIKLKIRLRWGLEWGDSRLSLKDLFKSKRILRGIKRLRLLKINHWRSLLR